MTAKAKPTAALKIGASQLRLLERLSNACAVSGDEGEVRKIVLESIRPLVDHIEVDALGNVLAVRTGHAPGPRLRVMVDAHMDEVGFMLTKDEGDGFYRFDTIGGIDPRFLAGKVVLVGKDHTPAVIGAKPIHLVEKDETKKMLSLDSLRMDVGQTGTKVKVGDRATFATRFDRLGPSLRGKALDDRLGVATLIELARHVPDHIDLLLSFAVQEELGLRGAGVAAYALQPDVAFALDCTPANDLPVWDHSENNTYNTRLGAGPALYIADSRTLGDPRLFGFLMTVAESQGIPYQIRQPGGGGTDAGAIHLQHSGIPSISVSVPGRYLHTPASLVRLEDWQNTLALMVHALTQLTPALLSAERP
jgi:endoglucanase